MTSRAAVDREWSAEDVVAAHAMLDALDEAERKAVAAARARASEQTGRSRPHG